MSEATNTAQPALLPCPFCGGAAQLSHGQRYVFCPDCNANGPDFSPTTKPETIALWNKRVATQSDAAKTALNRIAEILDGVMSNARQHKLLAYAGIQQHMITEAELVEIHSLAKGVA